MDKTTDLDKTPDLDNTLPKISSENQQLSGLETVFTEILNQCDKIKADILDYSKDPKKGLAPLREKMLYMVQLQRQICTIRPNPYEAEKEKNWSSDFVGSYRRCAVTKIGGSTQTQETEVKSYSERDKKCIEGFHRLLKLYTSEVKKEPTHEEMKEQALKCLHGFCAFTSRKEPNGLEDKLLIVCEKTNNVLDPITKLPIEDPVKSSICNHSYDKSTILKHLENPPQKCPYSECEVLLRSEDLLPNHKLRIRIMRSKFHSPLQSTPRAQVAPALRRPRLAGVDRQRNQGRKEIWSHSTNLSGETEEAQIRSHSTNLSGETEEAQIRLHSMNLSGETDEAQIRLHSTNLSGETEEAQIRFQSMNLSGETGEAQIRTESAGTP